MGKILLIAAIVALTGCGIWFYRLGGPAQLDLVDRWYMGGGTRHQALIETSVDYGPDGDPRQRYDVYHPAATGSGDSCGGRKFPTLIFFHGGSWRDGDRASYGFLGRAFSERGYYVVIADYRKTPQWRYPAFVKDAARVIADIHRNPRACTDPDRLFVMGHSAGAHIAMLAALDPKWLAAEGLRPEIIAGVIGLAGPYDFLPFTSDGARAALGHWPKPEETQPIHYARGDAPSLLLLTGDADTTVKPRNSDKLADAVTDKGGKAMKKIYPDVGHSGIIMAVARPFRGKAPVIDDVAAFIAKPGV